MCRFLLAASFIFSGFVKAVDPLGFQYKIQDYLTAFGMDSWFPSFFPLLGGITLSAIEFFIGISLFFATRRTLATSLALMLMIFMTPLTLYLAIFDPVSDCGCFGDAWVLTNWETFGKNIVLLFAAMMAFRHRRMLIRFISVKMEWLVSLYTGPIISPEYPNFFSISRSGRAGAARIVVVTTNSRPINESGTSQ